MLVYFKTLDYLSYQQFFVAVFFLLFSHTVVLEAQLGWAKEYCLLFSLNICETICFVEQSSCEPIKPLRLMSPLGNVIVVRGYVNAFGVNPTNQHCTIWINDFHCVLKMHKYI